MILLTIFGVVVGINILFYIYFLRLSSFTRRSAATDSAFSVSVIVCAKNEADNLRQHIPHILSQDYKNFELILVNDNSSDDTLDVMHQFEKLDDKVVVVDVEGNEAFWGSKKYALTLGIKKARHNRLLFTDADCKPAGKDWIREMTSGLNNDKQIVLGYGGYSSSPGFLNRLIRYETVMTAMQYFSMALHGKPYMGVGRNLAYTSNIFYENKGFIGHMDVKSGDDDLFVNEAASRDNVVIQTIPSSFTYSEPKKTWKSWIRQKRRHYTTSKHYKLSHKVFLGTFYLSNAMFWLVATIAWYPENYLLWALMIALRLAVQWTIVGRTAIYLQEKKLLVLIPLLELFLILIQLSIFISGRSTRQANWK